MLVDAKSARRSQEEGPQGASFANSEGSSAKAAPESIMGNNILG